MQAPLQLHLQIISVKAGMDLTESAPISMGGHLCSEWVGVICGFVEDSFYNFHSMWTTLFCFLFAPS